MYLSDFCRFFMYLWVGEEGGEGDWRRGGGAREGGIECLLYGYS
jgi:hypothetical protein